MNEVQRLRKILKCIFGIIAFLSSGMIFILLIFLLLVGGITSAVKFKQEQERVVIKSNVLPNGLTEFSYFCIYESGGENLYNAVLGDRGHAFGAYQFDNRYDLQPFLQWAYEKNPMQYAAFAPYLSASRDSLQGNTGLANAWHSIYAADPSGFSRLQDEYVVETKWKPILEFHKARGLDLSNRPDVVKGLCVSIHNRKGYETSGYSYITKSGVTNATSDEAFIIQLSECFGNDPARGRDIHDRWLVDYSSAACGLICEKNMVLSILKDGMSKNSDIEDFDGEMLTSVPYYNQGDYGNVGFNGRTVATSGCGITSFSMVASYFTGRKITPAETAPWAMSHGANTVTNWGSYAILAPHYGITLESQGTGPLWGGSAEPIIQALRQGKLVIGSQTGGYFNPSNGGHYIVYTGITSLGKITINDPGNRAKTQESASNNGFNQDMAFSHCKQYWIFSK